MSRNKERADFKPIQQVLTRIGDKWTVPILVTLSNGSVRFNELHRSIGGISQRMLTVTLRSLELDGLLIRTVHPSVPPHVEYELSDRGRALSEVLHPVIFWIFEHHQAIEESRQGFDRKQRWPGRWRSAMPRWR